MMGTIASGALAVTMIAAFLLTAGGIRLIIGREYRRQGLLMLLAALVLVCNVLVWAI